jgi:hypothetical protein
MKVKYEDALKRLKFEISNYLRDSVYRSIEKSEKTELDVVDKTCEKKKPISEKENSVLVNVIDWSETQVENWTKQKKIINDVIIQNILPCDGKILAQIYKIQKQAPEYFYNSISGKNTISLKDAAVFAYELETLFSSAK